MPRYLAFALHAPLAAFGAVAVGERRPSWDRPGRSALLGMVAAALGIDRSDEAMHLALDRGYGIAVRTDSVGRMLADYHTVQVPPAQRGRRHATRADELSVADLGTILTRREYRTDAVHLAALWERADAPRPLDTLAAALRQPAYVLYLGRKGCPLGLPLDPRLLDAADPEQALAAREAVASEPERRLRQDLRAVAGPVALDADATDPARVQRLEHRRDRATSRARWQFALRAEAVLRPPDGGTP